MRTLLQIFTIIIFCNNAVFGQFEINENISYTGYTTEDGLSGNEVTKTITDANGFLWIATHNGLSKFDGKKFKTYTYNPTDSTSLRSIWVTDLILDKNNIVWATTEWGVCWYDELYDRFRYINKKNDLVILYKAPLTASIDGNLILACENGLYKIDIKHKILKKISISLIQDPVSIVEDNTGKIWIGTRGNGLLIYDPASNFYSIFKDPKVPIQTHFMQIKILQNEICIATSEGILFIDNNKTATLYNNGIKSASQNSSNQLTAFEILNNHEIVCCTYNKKLIVFNKLFKRFTYQWKTQNNLPSAAFINIHKMDNILWLSTQSGLYKIESGFKDFNIFNIVNGTEKKFYQSVLPHKSNKNFIWLFDVGLKSKLDLFNIKNSKVIKTTNCKSANSSAYNKSKVIQHNNGNIYTICNYYINVFDKNGVWLKEIVSRDKMYTACLDTSNNLWIGTENGMSFLDVQNNKILNFPLRFTEGTTYENNSFLDNFPVTGIVCKNGMLWIANIKFGLFSYNIQTKKMIAHRQSSDLNYETLNRCSSIIVTNDSIWAGNMSGLTLYIPSKNTFKNYNIGNGLTSTYIYDLALSNRGSIWGRGNVGVFNFDIKLNKFTSFSLPAKYEGLYDIQRLTTDSNKCYLGLINGFTVFDETKNISLPKEVFITSVTINGKPNYSYKKRDILKYNQNNLQFTFTTINFNNEPISLYYNLKGLNEEWILANDKNSVLFSNLPPGKYSFNVKAKLNGKEFNNNKAYFFEIKAAFWQTWWFKLLIFCLLFGIIIFISKAKVNAIKTKEKNKTQVNKMMGELETKLLRSQMNPHFIFNSLNSIQKYIWESKEEEAAEYLSSFAKLIRAILENSKKDFITLKVELDIIKRYVELEQRRSNNQFEFILNLDESLNIETLLIPPLLLQPFIENAIWHGLNKKSNSGLLKISVLQVQNNVQYIIDDDGVGRNNSIAMTINKKSLGIEITKQRIKFLLNKEDISNNLMITDKMHNGCPLGTTISITLPIKYSNA